MSSERILRVVSFDGGGGARSFSQLKIMKVIMHRIQRDNNYPQNKVMLPCEHFDLMGGSDTGGLFVIMFVKLRMSVDEAIEEFGGIVEKVYMPKLQPDERTRSLRTCMEAILLKKDLPLDLRLDDDRRDGPCLGFVIAAREYNISSQVRLRTYPTRNNLPQEFTLIEAALATCASLPEFLHIVCGPRYERQPYVGASNSEGASNPVEFVLAEAQLQFGADLDAISLLSLGSGHPGTVSLLSEGLEGAMDRLDDLARRMIRDCEQTAQNTQRRIGHIEIFFRFSVEQGMQLDRHAYNDDFGRIAAQTDNYLEAPETSQKLDQYLKRSVTSINSGGQIVVKEQAPAYHVRHHNIQSRINMWLSRSHAHRMTSKHSQTLEMASIGLRDGPHSQNVVTRSASLDSYLPSAHPQQRRNSDAGPVPHMLLSGWERHSGEQNPGTLHTMSRPTPAHPSESRYSIEEVLQTDRDRRLEVASCEWKLAVMYVQDGRLSEARVLAVKAGETRASLLGLNHSHHKDIIGLIELIDRKSRSRIELSLPAAYLLLFFVFVMFIIAILA